jgi:hypothetical protein
MSDRPERPKVNPHFEASERLYRRIPLADVQAAFISNASISLPAFSVDRETYLENGPADTLRDYPDMGLAWFCVGDIPSSLVSGTGELFRFGVEHKPTEADPVKAIRANPAHSEVLSYSNGGEASKLPDGVKKKFRDALRLKAQILPAKE